VLLTGASAGVGEELAYHYARLGSHLVLSAPTEALLQKVSHRISPFPVQRGKWKGEDLGGERRVGCYSCNDLGFLCDLGQVT
jgi:corticosteroid 11-beta-dehydrogenase isozyme 1